MNQKNPKSISKLELRLVVSMAYITSFFQLGIAKKFWVYRTKLKREHFIVIHTPRKKKSSLLSILQKQTVSGITAGHLILMKGKWHRILRLLSNKQEKTLQVSDYTAHNLRTVDFKIVERSIEDFGLVCFCKCGL